MNHVDRLLLVSTLSKSASVNTGGQNKSASVPTLPVMPLNQVDRVMVAALNKEAFMGAAAEGAGLLGKNLFNLGTRQVGKAVGGMGEMFGGKALGNVATRTMEPAAPGILNRMTSMGGNMVNNSTNALKSNVGKMPGWAQGVSGGFNRAMDYSVPGKIPFVGGWNPARSTLNPFSMQNMMFGDLNPLHKLPGVGGAYNFTSTIPRKEGEQEGAYNAAAQFAHTAETMPMMQRLGFLFNPTGLRDQLPPEVLQRMQQMYPQQQG